jgi:hypothetical protein
MRRPLLVPAPSVCPTCEGERVVGTSILDELDGDPPSSPCPDCCCGVCGEPTDTPPECDRCACEDEAAAKRRDDR